MSTTTTSKTKAAALARLQAMIIGLQKLLPNETFALGGVAYTTAALVLLLQSWIDALNVLNAAQAGAKDAFVALGSVKAKVGPVYLALKRDLVNQYGSANQTLATYGLAPRKAPVPMTVEQLAVRKAKAKATRIARGTSSKKSKSSVTGNVVGVEMTPKTVAPVDPPPAAQPAPVATSVPTPGTSK